MALELFKISEIQRPDWIFNQRGQGMLGYSAVVVRKIQVPDERFAVVAKFINSVWWTCSHIHRSENSALTCAKNKIKTTIYKI